MGIPRRAQSDMRSRTGDALLSGREPETLQGSFFLSETVVD